MKESNNLKDSTESQKKDIRSQLSSDLVKLLKKYLENDNSLNQSDISSICKLVESERIKTNDVVSILEKSEEKENGH